MDLVLLPGMLCSPRLWAGVRAAGLHEAVTERGHGRVLTPHLDGATLQEAVGLLLDRLPARFALAGLSLGGIVAMALTRTAPERVAGLALLDTNPRPPTPAQQDGWASTLRALADSSTPREVQRDLLPVLLSEQGRSRPDLVEATLAMADEVGAERLRGQLLVQTTRVDERPGLRSYDGPTLVLCGEVDALCPVERHDEIVAALPSGDAVRQVVIPGAGHLSPLESPTEVADALTSWYATTH